nr:lasso peptide biosynthesis B2 protein [Micromonospora sp. DSM 115978]
MTLYPYLALVRGRALLRSGGLGTLVKALPPQPGGQRAGTPDRVAAAAAECARAARLLPLRTRCLERSYGACATLRRRGVSAVLCVGVTRCPPMRFHAWVETDGQVVNDSPDLPDRYRVICVY